MSLLQPLMDGTSRAHLAAEDLPNADESSSSFPTDAPNGNGGGGGSNNNSSAHGVLQQLTAQQLHEAGLIKTTHIHIIHDQTSRSLQSALSEEDEDGEDEEEEEEEEEDDDEGLKTPPLPGGLDISDPLGSCLENNNNNNSDHSSSNNNNVRENDNGHGKYKYNWDESVHAPVLPIRCKSTSGELHKDKFGSGGRGRCIRSGNMWFSPSEFEAKCGRASSKDWKRSIRYGGRTLQCLIEEGILLPHATSCTCSACCDDTSVTGPVRLFVPYKRRKKEGEPGSVAKALPEQDAFKDLAESPLKDPVTMAIAPATTGIVLPPLSVSGSSGNAELVSVLTADATLVSNPNPGSDSPLAMSSMNSHQKTAVLDFNEQKQWWQLEEMVNNLINYGQQLKQLLEQVKTQSIGSREIALQQLRVQLEKEKNDAVNAARIEGQLMIHRALLEDRAEKEDLVIQNQRVSHIEKCNSKRCANCNREAFSECTGCHSVSYCSSFCQQKDWALHQQECGTTSIVLVREVSISEEEKD